MKYDICQMEKLPDQEQLALRNLFYLSLFALAAHVGNRGVREASQVFCFTPPDDNDKKY